MKILPRLLWSCLFWCGLSFLGESGCANTESAGEAGFTIGRAHFTSGRVEIIVDVYTPRSATRSQPILVLHGAGGMLFDGPEMSRMARALARAGFTVYQVHYFDRTHTWFAREAVLLKLFPTWLGTVHDAVEWVHSLHPATETVGIFGYSLGAFAAVEEARRNPRVGAVVEQAGGFWQGHPEGPTRQPLPPMLLIHGLADERVPVAKYAEPLLAFLREHHDRFETHFFDREGHDFSAPARARVRAEAVDFFRRHLRRTSV